jgi:hypothetical protein
MQTTFALVALAAVAHALPQAVTTAGCSSSYSGDFEITILDPPPPKAKRDSTCGQEGYLTLKLDGGVLTDAKGRTGYIASNYQFQFDAPPQANALSSGGFAVCSNGSLALASSNIFYKCLSGDFYNLYDRSWAPQCAPIIIDILPCGAGTVGQQPDGQPTGVTVGPAPVTQIGDGQPQATTGIPVSEYTDGQPQVVTNMPAPVTQISDGQVQATTATPAPVPVTQISDVQVQATTATPALVPVTQISDGQIQATTATPAPAPVTQISDGQIQATTAAPVPVSSSPAVVTQISDGQVQAPNATTTPIPFTGAATGMSVTSSFAAMVFGLAAVLLL